MSVKRNLIYDVGLHKGEDTDFYLKKGYNAVAFGADPDLIAHCRRRFQAEILQGRLRVVEGAIAGEGGMGRLSSTKIPAKRVGGPFARTGQNGVRRSELAACGSR